jgi:hypothetical protein
MGEGDAGQEVMGSYMVRSRIIAAILAIFLVLTPYLVPTHALAEMRGRLSNNGDFYCESLNLDGVLNLRNADDRRIIENRFKKLSGRVELNRKERFLLAAGNVTSRGGFYTYNRSALGTLAEFKTMPSTTWRLEFSGLSGQLNPAEDGKKYARYLFGAKADLNRTFKNQLIERLKLYTSYAYTEDDINSIGPVLNLSAFDNNVAAIGFETGLRGDIGFSGEFGYSSLDNNQDSSQIRDTAVSVKLNKMFSFKGDLKGEYAKVMPEFRSLSGGGSPDSEKWTGSYGQPILDYANLSATYTNNRNNLEDHRAETTTWRTPGLNLSLTPFRFFKDRQGLENMKFVYKLSYTDRKTGLSSHSQITNQRWEIQTNVVGINPAAYYRLSPTHDKIDSQNDRDTREWGLSLSHPDAIGTSFSFLTGRRSLRAGLSFQIIQSREGLKIGDKNKRQTYRISSKGEYEHFKYNLKFDYGNADMVATGQDTSRKDWAFSLSRSFKRLKNMHCSLDFKHSDYNSEHSNQNFQEVSSLFKTTINW